MKRFLSFFSDLYKSRYLIWQLTKRDVTQKYKRSKLGMFWSLAEPLAFIFVLYIVFGIGLRGGADLEMPFICYLVTGISVINFFNETMNSGTVSIRSHSYLLKKINIRLSILPVSTVLTGVIHHLLFLIAVIVIFLINGITPDLYWLQAFYYMFSISMLLVGVCWFTSAIGVFIPDLQSIITVLTRILFYFTPVFWNIETMPESLQKYLKLNPIYYIVTGYRNSFFYKIPFWENNLTLYFWIWVLSFLVIGSFIFRRLRPQFADFI